MFVNDVTVIVKDMNYYLCNITFSTFFFPMNSMPMQERDQEIDTYRFFSTVAVIC